MNVSDHLLRPAGARSLPGPERPGAPEPSWDEGTGTATESLDLWGFVRRNAWLIVASSLVVAGAAFVVTKRITPTYAATASIRIDQKASPALDVLGLGQGNAVATELEMLRSRVLAEEVVDSLGLQLVVRSPAATPRSELFSSLGVERTASPAEYRVVSEPGGRAALVDRATKARVQVRGPAERFAARGMGFALAPSALADGPVDIEVRSFPEAVDALRANLEISRRNRDAEIIDVSYRGTDAALASDIVNLMARRFVGGRQSVRQAEARHTVRFLREQIARVSGQLTGAERDLRDFREREHIVSLADEASTGVARRAELQAQRNALDAERQSLQALLRSSERAGGRDSSHRDLLAFPSFLRSMTAASLLGSLTSAEERRSDLLTRRTPEDPDVQVLDLRIAQLRGQIESLAGTYLAGLTSQIRAIDATLAQSDARLQSIPTKELRLAELERMTKGNEAIYSMLENRLQEAQIAAASSDQSVRLVDPAVVPRKPVSPRPLLNFALALVVGATLGAAGAFAREMTDRSLHTRRDLLTSAGVPVLGLVPRAAPRRRLQIRRQEVDAIGAHARALFPRADATARHQLQKARPGSRQRRDYSFTLSESFSWLATNLAFLRAESPIRALLVTSALPGDGKTTVATGLAMTLARNGRRILLVDADVRGGRIADALKLPSERGLSDWLGDGTDLQGIVRRMELAEGAELHVITAGAARETPVQLLASERVRELIEWARPRYDYTIIDTAPVNVAADAALLATRSDGVIVVARAGVTERGAIEFAMEQLALVHAPIVGAVLNDVDLERDAGYDRAYRYYGRYDVVPG